MNGLLLDTPCIDIARLVNWTPSPCRTRWRTASGDERAGQEGVALGVIGLKHASGYEVVLQLDNGKIDSFAPIALLPVIEAQS